MWMHLSPISAGPASSMLAPLLLIIKLIFGGLLGAGIGLFMAKSLRITLGAVFISYWLIFVWDDNGPLVTLGTDITFYEVLGGLALLALIVRIKLLGKKVRRNKTLSIILFFLSYKQCFVPSDISY